MGQQESHLPPPSGKVNTQAALGELPALTPKLGVVLLLLSS